MVARALRWVLAAAILASLGSREAWAANITSTQSGNWGATSTWVGGVVPVAGDNVTIANGHTITVVANAACATITVNATGATANGISISSGILLDVSGAISMTSPSVANTSTIAVGAGSLNAASISIPGSATAGRNCVVSVSTGTITVSGSVSFAGTASRAQFTSTGASTVNIAGSFGSGGTLTTSGTGTFNFNGGAAQTIGTYTTFNNVTINNTSGGVTLTGTTTVGGALNVNTGTLTIGAFTSTVTGATSVSGTLTISSTTGTKTFGDITINNGGTMSFTAAEDITSNGNLQVDGTGAISGTAGTWTFQKAGGGGTISGSAASISITNATFTTSYTASTNISTTNLTLTTGTFDVGSTALTVAGNFTNNATFTTSTGSVTMSGAAKTISGSSSTTFYDLTASGTITAAQAITINHNLTVNAAASFNASTFAITGSGTNTLTNSGTLGAGAATFGTNYVSFETMTYNSGSTIDYTGSSAQTVDQTISYVSLAHSGTATATAGGNLTIAENLTISAGTLDLSTFTANRTTSGGTLSMSGGTLKIGGTNGIPSNYSTHTYTGGTIEYGGTNQTVAVEAYRSLAISGSGTKTLAGATTLLADLTLTASTLSTSGSNYALNVAGNWTNNGGTLSGGTSTVTFTGSGKTISGTNSTTFPAVVIKSGASYTMSNDNSCNSFSVTAAADINPCSFTHSGTSALTVNGNASVVKLDDLAATWNVNAGSATISGNLTLSATGSNQASGVAKVTLTTGTLTISGNLVHTNALSAASSVVNLTGAATVNLAGAYTVNTLGTQTPGTTSIFNYNGSASAQTVSLASAITYANLYLNNTNASGATLGAAVTTSNVVSNLRVLSGTLSNGGFAVDGGAADLFEVVNGATFKLTSTSTMVTGFGTRTFGATSTVDYAGTNQTVGNEAYGNLTLSGSGTKTMPGSALSVATNFTTAGTASATAAAAVTVGGNVVLGSGTTIDAASFTHNVAGNWSNNGATFTASTSTITMNGTAAQAIGGSAASTFNNLTILNSSATVSASTNLNVSGTCTISAGAVLSPAAAIVINSGGAAGTITGSGTAQVTRTTATADYSSQFKFTTNTLTNLTVEYAGAAAQTVSALSYGSLKINNSSGVTLAGSATVNGTCTFTSGIVTTGGSSLIISSTGSVSRTSGHVFGNLQKNVATGSSVSRTYEIGDATNYTPVNLVFASVSVAGNLTAKTTAGDHPNIASSDIFPSYSANRYWTLTNSGVTFTNFNATFNYVSGDLDAGAIPASFVARSWNGSSWSSTTPGTNTSTSTQITGQTAFGDFQCGNALSVSASNSAFAFGTQPANTWLTAQSSVITNDSPVSENVVAQISTFTAGANTWTLSAVSNGADQVRAQWSTTSNSGPWNDISSYASNFTIASGLAASGTVTLYFRIQSPTSVASASQYSSALTVTAQ